MPLDFFVENKDTGFNYNEAIQPVENGEDANQTTFRRPSENVRTRTEDIRKLFDLLEAVVASDRGLTLMAKTDAYVDWDSGTGKFDVTDSPSGGGAARDFYIIPLLSTAQGPSGSTEHIPATFVYNDAGNGVFITEAASDLRDHGDGTTTRSGANNLFIEVVESTRTTGGVVISVSGDEDGSLTFPEDGPVLITIEMEQGGNTAGEIVTALQTAGDHDSYINTDPTKTKVLFAGNCTKEVTRRRFADGDVYDDSGTWYRSMGAVDAEGIEIDNTTLGSFFATSGNELDEGDTLIVDFTGANDRLNNQTGSSMTDMLVKLSAKTGGSWENLDSGHTARRHVVPICKVFDGNLYFLNGTMVESGKPGRLIPDPGDVNELQALYDAHVAGTADQHADADITAGAHDGTGDPTDTTLPMSLPDSSQVRAHINELCQGLNRHMDGEIDNFKHPEGDITAVAKPGDIISLSGTDVGAQLGELTDALDNHVDGSNASYHHPWTDIDDRPVYVVDKAGDGDYTEINAAINDATLGANGAVIIVKSGDYTTDISIPGHAATLTIIGEGMTPAAVSNGVKLTGKITVADNQAAPTIFKNIEFDQDASGYFFNCGYEGATGGLTEMGCVVFEDCIFVRSTSVNTIDFFRSAMPLHFLRCQFIGEAPSVSATCLRFYRLSTADGNTPRWTVHDCVFTDWNTLVRVDDGISASDKLGTLIFVGNHIKNCGYTTASGASVLIQAEDCHVVVEGNIWRDEGASLAESGEFFYGSGASGSVSHNRLLRGIRVSPSSTSISQYAVSCASCAIAVVGNYINTAFGGGILANTGDYVAGNTLYNFAPDEADQAMLSGSAAFVGNLLEAGTITGTSVSVVLLYSGARFTGNRITNVNKSDARLITVNTFNSSAGRDHITIANNTLEVTDALHAIYVSAGGTTTPGAAKNITITGNTIEGVRNGVYMSGSTLSDATYISYVLVSSNAISINANGVYGVYVDGDDEICRFIAIIGNIFHSENGTGDYGIYVEDDTDGTDEDVAIGQNMFDYTHEFDYSVPSGGGCGMRNEADSAYTMTQNWWIKFT